MVIEPSWRMSSAISGKLKCHLSFEKCVSGTWASGVHGAMRQAISRPIQIHGPAFIRPRSWIRVNYVYCGRCGDAVRERIQF